MSNLERAYNDCLEQQQGKLTGQSLLNSTVYGLSAPSTSTLNRTSESETTQTPGIGQILGGLGPLAIGIGTGGLGFAPFAAAGAVGAAGGAASMFSGGLSSNYMKPFSIGG